MLKNAFQVSVTAFLERLEPGLYTSDTFNAKISKAWFQFVKQMLTYRILKGVHWQSLSTQE